MAEDHVSHTSLSYLVAVAKLRCSLSVVAELLHSQQTVECWQYTSNNEFVLFIEEAKKCCYTLQLNDQNQAGPTVYLMKLLMRRYGPSFLYSMCKNTDHLWVVPEHLQIDEVRTYCMHHMYTYFHFHCVSTVHAHVHTCTHITHRKIKGWTVLSSMIPCILNSAMRCWMLLMVNK